MGDATTNKATIEQLVISKVDAAAASVRDAAITAIVNGHDRLLQSLQKEVAAAIERNQSFVISAAPPEPRERESRSWKILVVVLPIVLTTILGFVVWQVQKGIEITIANQAETLKTELAVREEFYKRKLDTYEKTHEQIAALVEALDNAKVDAGSRGSAITGLRLIHADVTGHNLYMSNDVVESVLNLWRIATDLPTLRPGGSGNMSAVLDAIATVERKMKDDLEVREIGQTSRILGRAGS